MGLVVVSFWVWWLRVFRCGYFEFLDVVVVILLVCLSVCGCGCEFVGVIVSWLV